MQHSLPSHASVVVIGGGIMGCSTLYHLVEMGVGDAVLLERNKLTSGTLGILPHRFARCDIRKTLRA